MRVFFLFIFIRPNHLVHQCNVMMKLRRTVDQKWGYVFMNHRIDFNRKKITKTTIPLHLWHKWLVIVQCVCVCVFVCICVWFCSDNWILIEFCFCYFSILSPFVESLVNCNATFSGFQASVPQLQNYVNEQIVKSFDYLLLSSNFGTFVKNRPGFAKQFKGLSDKAWSRSIDLIKHITKRGGEHKFEDPNTPVTKPVLELDEINALSFALDTEKSLALTAHRLHERYSHTNHAHGTRQDPEVFSSFRLERKKTSNSL